MEIFSYLKVKCIQLLDPIIVDTQLVCSCGDWSPNGMYIAVGGSPSNATQGKTNEPEQVNIYDPNGKVTCFYIFSCSLC